MAETVIREEEDLDRRPSAVVLPQLQEPEKQFFEIVGGGNLAEVRAFLESHADFNVNVVNFQGVSALHIAVQDRNVPMVEYLLSQNADVGDTALHAVRENEPRIAVVILDRLKELNPDLEYAGVTHSSDFPDDTTPLSVAAQYGHYELISLLLERGHVLVKPHPPSCYCEEVCKSQRSTEDPLTLDKMRLALYAALANPAYICLTSEDPILTAFQLAVELKTAAIYERVFYHAYKTLSEKVSIFATELIGCARTTEEVEIVLKQHGDLEFSTQFVYPRLLLAMDYKQKGFVAHPNVQQVMENKWMGDWYEWKIKSGCRKVLSVIPRIFMLPLITIMVLIAPNSARTKHWQLPVNKLLSSVASYIIFLVFVFIESNIDKSNQLRGPPNSGFEPILVIYVVSYIWSAFRLCMIQGPKRFFQTSSNWYEAIMLYMFLMTFIFWIAAAMDVTKNGQRDLERKYWHKYDPTLVAEGIFCIATIMAFFKLMFVCQLDYHLGPLQMSLGKMINDVGKFIAIFIIIMIAFTAGLNRFYQYYEEMVQIDDESKIKIQQASSFVNLASTLKTLFWAIFCMSPIESADVIIENLPGETEMETIINRHSFTETIGYFIFAVFEFISVVVVLNMLIACMANTFTKITDNVDVEWRFGRTKVYIDYMTYTTLPPPFNLLPTRGGFRTMAEYIKILVKPPPNKRARWDVKHCCYIENLDKGNREDFSVVMGQLVQRYFRKKNSRTEETDIEGLRKELVELRSLLRDALSPA